MWEQTDDIGTDLTPLSAAVCTLPYDVPTFTGRHRELARLLDGPVGIIAGRQDDARRPRSSSGWRAPATRTNPPSAR